MILLAPENWLGAGEAIALLVVLGLATLGTRFLIDLAAIRRRRSMPYPLLAAAIGLLVSRNRCPNGDD